MLVLSRAKNEEIVVEIPGYEPLIIGVMKCPDGAKIRLGITADKRIAVHRREIWEKIQQQKEPPK